jgi:predicted Ser/Thr protein kinase
MIEGNQNQVEKISHKVTQKLQIMTKEQGRREELVQKGYNCHKCPQILMMEETE